MNISSFNFYQNIQSETTTTILQTEKQRNNSVNLQYECLQNLHEDFMRILHNFPCNLFSVTAHYFESTVQDIEAKGKKGKFNGILLLKIF